MAAQFYFKGFEKPPKGIPTIIGIGDVTPPSVPGSVVAGSFMIDAGFEAVPKDEVPPLNLTKVKSWQLLP